VNRWIRVVAALAAGAAGLTISGCGRGGAAAATSSAAASAQVARQQSPPPSPPCHTSQVRLGGGQVGGLLGTEVVMFSITNVSEASCTLVGYPAVRVLSADRHLVPAKTGYGEAGPKEPTAVFPVLLKPSAAGEFGLSFTDHSGPASAGDCVAFSFVRALLPDKQLTNAVSVSTGHVLACGGKYGPQILVSPVGPLGG
jgi:hypothetical protein